MPKHHFIRHPSEFRARRREFDAHWRNYLPMMLSGLLTGLLIASIIWIWQRLNDPHTLPFREIRITGQLQHLQAAQIRQTLSQRIHNGFFALKLEPLKQSLISNPWVEDVAIRRIPGILFVAVKEHQAVAQWNDNYLINSDDQFFSAPVDAPKGLPLLQGPQENSTQVLKYYKEMNNMLKPLQLRLQRITLNKALNWEIQLNNGLQIDLGSDEVLEHMQRLVKWYPKIVNDKVDQIVHIDLRYSNGIAVQFKNRI